MSKFKSRYPISESCPQCGGREYKRREPETYIAFVDDRECKVCQTRYTPPTPAWAAVVFLLIGVLGVGVDVFFIVVGLMRPGMGLALSFRSGLVGAACAFVGIACIVHGLRSLMKSRSQPGVEEAHSSFHRRAENPDSYRLSP
jgi:hypothetical protein